jgi:murein DD-endopeptidase MepM/ murein hydrolase activator NlpD
LILPATPAIGAPLPAVIFWRPVHRLLDGGDCMSREGAHRAGGRLTERWGTLTRSAASAYHEFYQSRLFIQVLLSLLIIGAAFVAGKAPIGPLRQVRDGLHWAVMHPYDFKGKFGQARSWAAERGGWRPALTGMAVKTQNRLKGWAGPWLPDSQFDQPAFTNRKAEIGSVPVQSPPAMPVNGAVMHGFGWVLPRQYGEVMHEGIDFLAPVGAPVWAAADGTVIRVGADPQLGQVVEIDHGTMITLYGPLAKIQVVQGAKVLRGTVLGAVGQPLGLEKEMEPHLHFEVRTRDGRVPVDPALYLGLGGNRL